METIGQIATASNLIDAIYKYSTLNGKSSEHAYKIGLQTASVIHDIPVNELENRVNGYKFGKLN